MKTPEKPTKDCFTSDTFSYRDSDFDKWLPKTQPAKEGTVTAHQLPRDMTFKEMAVHFLGSDDIETVRKHTLTLPMLEEMVANRRGELETTGWGNFAFVENNDGGVSVAGVGRGGPRWYAHVFEFSRGGRWNADHRLMVFATSDSTTLQNLDSKDEFDESFISRFWKNVEKTDTCWNWKKAKDEQGYGLVKSNGKHLRAHRVSVLMSGREIPEGYEIDHLCTNPSCVNPLHLEPVTPQVNSQRRASNKMNPESVLEVRELRANGELLDEIAITFKVSKSTISRIINGETWNNL